MGSFAVSTYVLIFWLHNQVGCALGALNPPASVPIPSQPLGIVLGNGSATAPVQIEVFLELLCPDSSATWRKLKQLYRSYDSTKVRFVVYQFPLPYHSNGFMVTQTLFQVAKMKPEKTYTYMERIFYDMARYSTASTLNKTPNTVLRELAATMSDVTGIGRQEILSSYDRYASSVVTAWKYAARRGVAGTPWHFVNGVELVKNAVPLTMEEYRAIIDSLLPSSDNVPVQSYLIDEEARDSESSCTVGSQQAALIILLVSCLLAL